MKAVGHGMKAVGHRMKAVIGERMKPGARGGRAAIRTQRAA